MHSERKFCSTVFGMPDPPLHDPLAVAYVIEPGMFITKKYKVDIETASPYSFGQTVVDTFNLESLPYEHRNANVALSVRTHDFWEIMLAAINISDSCSPLNVCQ